jgi:hypothetical protein
MRHIARQGDRGIIFSGPSFNHPRDHYHLSRQDICEKIREAGDGPVLFQKEFTWRNETFGSHLDYLQNNYTNGLEITRRIH